MTDIKSFFKFTSLCFGLPLTIAIVYALEVFSPSNVRSLAQSQQVSVSQGLTTNWGAYEPDPNIGKPARREGGGTRGPCIKKSANNKPLPLIPDNSFGVTIEDYPTFLVYLPGLDTATKPQMQFSLTSDDDREIYTTKSLLDGSQGVISISLPASANLPPLQVGKTYKWSFTLICDPDEAENGDNSGNSLVVGTIRREEPQETLKQKLARASSPRDRFLAYSAAGVWYDAVNSLAQLRRTQPNDSMLAKDWQELLNSVGLQTIASEPLLAPVATSDRPNPNVSRQP